MKVLLIGYGKMGKTIESILKEKGHSVPYICDKDTNCSLEEIKKGAVDVAIEFTEPGAAFNNIKACLEKGIPVVSGTTGWLEKRVEIEDLCHEKRGAFFYASNYSLGVNLFFELNRQLAELMNKYPEYNVSIEEVHHTQKKDKPSGTAITLAEGIINRHDGKSDWKLSDDRPSEKDIAITAIREPEVPGTHTIRYSSEADMIEIKHTAHSRKGFAEGAVRAAEWIVGKIGIFSMKDLMFGKHF